jgi:hypothetical protein
MNYEKLMKHNPTSLGIIVNSIGQEIEFFEHPLKGDEFPVIIVCHELKLADYTDFMETDDMIASHKEYEPSFVEKKLFIGGFEY